MPKFNPNNEDHAKISALARLVADETATIVAVDDYFNELNQLCAAVLETVADDTEGSV